MEKLSMAGGNEGKCFFLSPHTHKKKIGETAYVIQIWPPFYTTSKLRIPGSRGGSLGPVQNCLRSLDDEQKKKKREEGGGGGGTKTNPPTPTPHSQSEEEEAGRIGVAALHSHSLPLPPILHHPTSISVA